MSELGDTFGAWRKEKQEKRRQNIESSLECLRARGHHYALLSPHHVRVGEYDFWPSTGLWVHRTNRRSKGRGVLGLLIKLEGEKKFLRLHIKLEEKKKK